MPKKKCDVKLGTMCHVIKFYLTRSTPNFQPKTPLVESLLENIEWMDQHNRIPNSDEDLLEDKIISAIRKLPTQI